MHKWRGRTESHSIYHASISSLNKNEYLLCRQSQATQLEIISLVLFTLWFHHLMQQHECEYTTEE